MFRQWWLQFMALSTTLMLDILIVPTVWDTIYGSFYDFDIWFSNCSDIVFGFHFIPFSFNKNSKYFRGRHDRDRMVVGIKTTYAISAYHHLCCEFESRSKRGVQHYVIKFVSDLRQVGDFLRAFQFSPPMKLTATI